MDISSETEILYKTLDGNYILKFMKTHLLYFFFIILTFSSCKEEGRIDLIDESGIPPEAVSDVNITPIPGGATIEYNIPNDPNYLYAKVTYEAPTGVIREAKSSKFENKIVLKCYGDTLAHDISLVSVGKNTKESAPLIYTFKPKLAPIYKVANEMIVQEAFGGIQISYDNPTESNLIIEALIDSIGSGEYIQLDKLYTKALKGNFMIRGLDAKEYDFGIRISDPCGNQTDLKETTLTPLYEIEIPKSGFMDLRLPNDAVPLRPSNPITQLWDGVTNSFANFYSTDQSVYPLPKWISIDFGNKYILSRFKMWQRYNDEYTGGRFPTDWELYGSNDPKADGSWESWTLLQRFGPPGKPSGLPFLQYTTEDREFARRGFDYEFDSLLEEGYRYYRFKWYEVQDYKDMVLIGEMTFWGQQAN